MASISNDGNGKPQPQKPDLEQHQRIQELFKGGRISAELSEDISCAAALSSQVFSRFLEDFPQMKITSPEQLEGCIRLQWSRDFLVFRTVDKPYYTFDVDEVWYRIFVPKLLSRMLSNGERRKIFLDAGVNEQIRMICQIQKLLLAFPGNHKLTLEEVLLFIKLLPRDLAELFRKYIEQAEGTLEEIFQEFDPFLSRMKELIKIGRIKPEGICGFTQLLSRKQTTQLRAYLQTGKGDWQEIRAQLSDVFAKMKDWEYLNPPEAPDRKD